MLSPKLSRFLGGMSMVSKQFRFCTSQATLFFIYFFFIGFTSSASAQCVLIFPGAFDNPHGSNECNEHTYDESTQSATAAAEAARRGHDVSVANFPQNGSLEEVRDAVLQEVEEAILNNQANGGNGDVNIIGHCLGGAAVLSNADGIEQLAEDYDVNIEINTAGTPTGGGPPFLRGLMCLGKCFSIPLGEHWLWDVCSFKQAFFMGLLDFPATNLPTTQYVHPDDGMWSQDRQEPGPPGSSNEFIPGSTHKGIIGDVVKRETPDKG